LKQQGRDGRIHSAGQTDNHLTHAVCHLVASPASSLAAAADD
jgi:hypothetical protein